MKVLVILLVLIGFTGSVFAQNIGDSEGKIWLPTCTKGTQTECDQSSLFYSAISLPFTQSDSVAVGTIIQKENQGQNNIQYSINVDFYLKNYQPFDLLTATLINATEPESGLAVHYYNSPVFNEGDIVFAYLKKSGGNYELLPQSFALDKHEIRGPPPIILVDKSPQEDNFVQGENIFVSGEVRKMDLVKAAKDGKDLGVKVSLVKSNNRTNTIFSDLMNIEPNGNYNYLLDTSNRPPGSYELEVNYGSYTTGTKINIEPNWKIWTPLKQTTLGITFDEIQCKEDLILIQKYDGSPACVTESTKTKLIERGWTTQSQNKIEYQVISKDKVLSKGTGFDLPEDTFTEDDLRELEQHEKELRRILVTEDLLYEERDEIINEINSMQDRLQHPFQTGVPYHLVKMIKERYSVIDANFSELRKDVYFSGGSSQISHQYQALRIGIHPDHFSLHELKQQDQTIREYLGDEMNILYEKSLIVGSNEK